MGAVYTSQSDALLQGDIYYLCTLDVKIQLGAGVRQLLLITRLVNVSWFCSGECMQAASIKEKPPLRYIARTFSTNKSPSASRKWHFQWESTWSRASSNIFKRNQEKWMLTQTDNQKRWKFATTIT